MVKWSVLLVVQACFLLNGTSGYVLGTIDMDLGVARCLPHLCFDHMDCTWMRCHRPDVLRRCLDLSEGTCCTCSNASQIYHQRNQRNLYFELPYFQYNPETMKKSIKLAEKYYV